MNNITIVFINGRFSSELSDLSLLPKEVVFRADDFFLRVPKNCEIPSPIHLSFLNTKNTLRKIIELDENSRVSLIERYHSDTADESEINIATDILAAKNARIDYYKIQNENSAASHRSEFNVQQKQDSRVTVFFIGKGARDHSENTQISLTERGAVCELNGLYLLDRNNQSATHHVKVDHAAAHTESSMVYKGILDKKSRAEFTGRVHVQKNAKHINAQQANHHLLLSKDAEVKSKPELEIDADDVKCTHGSTVGQLDSEALFYLRSRGIEKNNAEKLLTEAFASEIIDKIEHVSIRDFIRQEVGQ